VGGVCVAWKLGVQRRRYRGVTWLMPGAEGGIVGMLWRLWNEGLRMNTSVYLSILQLGSSLKMMRIVKLIDCGS